MDSANLGNNLKKKPSSPRSLLGTIMTVLSALCLAVTVIPLFAVLGFVFVQGVGRLNANLFTKLPPPPGLGGGGIANAILGTIIVVALS
ncbi:MAG: phosphate ABC transporter, permease protein PstA, partial [Microcystis panniformis]